MLGEYCNEYSNIYLNWVYRGIVYMEIDFCFWLYQYFEWANFTKIKQIAHVCLEAFLFVFFHSFILSSSLSSSFSSSSSERQYAVFFTLQGHFVPTLFVLEFSCDFQVVPFPPEIVFGVIWISLPFSRMDFWHMYNSKKTHNVSFLKVMKCCNFERKSIRCASESSISLISESISVTC